MIVTAAPLILGPEFALPLGHSVSAAPLTLTDATLEEMVRQWIFAAVHEYGGNQTAAAAALGSTGRRFTGSPARTGAMT